MERAALLTLVALSALTGCVTAKTTGGHPQVQNKRVSMKTNTQQHFGDSDSSASSSNYIFSQELPPVPKESVSFVPPDDHKDSFALPSEETALFLKPDDGDRQLVSILENARAEAKRRNDIFIDRYKDFVPIPPVRTVLSPYPPAFAPPPPQSLPKPSEEFSPYPEFAPPAQPPLPQPTKEFSPYPGAEFAPPPPPPSEEFVPYPAAKLTKSPTKFIVKAAPPLRPLLPNPTKESVPYQVAESSPPFPQSVLFAPPATPILPQPVKESLPYVYPVAESSPPFPQSVLFAPPATPILPQPVKESRPYALQPIAVYAPSKPVGLSAPHPPKRPSIVLLLQPAKDKEYGAPYAAATPLATTGATPSSPVDPPPRPLGFRKRTKGQRQPKKRPHGVFPVSHVDSSVSRQTEVSEDVNSEGDSQSSLFLGENEEASLEPKLTFTHLNRGSIFDESGALKRVEPGTGGYQLDHGSYSFISPEKIPVKIRNLSHGNNT